FSSLLQTSTPELYTLSLHDALPISILPSSTKHRPLLYHLDPLSLAPGLVAVVIHGLHLGPGQVIFPKVGGIQFNAEIFGLFAPQAKIQMGPVVPGVHMVRLWGIGVGSTGKGGVHDFPTTG